MSDVSKGQAWSTIAEILSLACILIEHRENCSLYNLDENKKKI